MPVPRCEPVPSDARRGRWPRALTASLLALAMAGALVPLVGSRSVVAAGHEIAIREAGFEPPVVRVLVGEPVTWTNESGSPQAVASADGLFDSGPIAPGEAFGHVFEAPGTYAYTDAASPAHEGRIIVEAAPATPAGATDRPSPPEGTLPPNFSPFASTPPTAATEPTPAAATDAATATTGAATAAAGPAGGTDGGTGTGVPVLLVASVAAGALGGAWLARRRRSA